MIAISAIIIVMLLGPWLGNYLAKRASKRCKHEKTDWFHVEMGMRKAHLCLTCYKILDIK